MNDKGSEVRKVSKDSIRIVGNSESLREDSKTPNKLTIQYQHV